MLGYGPLHTVLSQGTQLWVLTTVPYISLFVGQLLTQYPVPYKCFHPFCGLPAELILEVQEKQFKSTRPWKTLTSENQGRARAAFRYTDTQVLSKSLTTYYEGGPEIIFTHNGVYHSSAL